MTTFLETIVASKRHRIGEQQRVLSLAEARAQAEARSDVRDFVSALQPAGRVGLIAEIKRASPSKGDLNLGLDARQQARLYATHASAISVLCEQDHFRGSLDDLRAARDETQGATGPVPILCKDFLFEPYQIWQAVAAGADSLLLIVTMLETGQAAELLALSRELGAEPLVEVHDEAEAERALAIGAMVVGVNNRDLRNFVTDIGVSSRVLPILSAQPGVIAVSESGIREASDVAALARSGARAVLVGEAIVTAGDPAATLAALATVPLPVHA